MKDFLKKELFELVDRFFGRESSREIANERLRFVLIHDRSHLEPERLEALKQDLIEVFSKYIEFDRSSVEIQFEKEEHSIALIANVPIQQLKRVRE